jgi:amino acid transporter
MRDLIYLVFVSPKSEWTKIVAQIALFALIYFLLDPIIPYTSFIGYWFLLIMISGIVGFILTGLLLFIKSRKFIIEYTKPSEIKATEIKAEKKRKDDELRDWNDRRGFVKDNTPYSFYAVVIFLVGFKLLEWGAAKEHEDQIVILLFIVIFMLALILVSLRDLLKIK